MIRAVLSDSGKYLIGVVLLAIVEILRTPLIAHLFSPREFGLYALVVGGSSFLAILSTAWLASAVIRFYPELVVSNRLEELEGLVLLLTIGSVAIVGISAIVVFYLLREYVSPDTYPLVVAGIILSLVVSVERVFLSLVRAQRRVESYVSYSVCQGVAGLGIGLALVVVLGLGVDGLLWGLVIATTVLLPVFWVMSLGVSAPRLKLASISSLGFDIARYGFPVAVINLLTWVMSSSDRYLIEFFRGGAEVGIYSAVYIISEKSIFVLVSVFSLASIPVTFNLWEAHGLERVQEFTSKISRIYLILALPATVGLAILSKLVVEMLLPPSYSAGYLVIPVVSAGAFLVGVANIYSNAIAIPKRTDILTLCYLGAAGTNVGLNLILIRQFGYMVAAVTTLAAYVAFLVLTLVVSRRFLVWQFPLKTLAKVSLASTVMGVVVFIIGYDSSFSKYAALVSAVAAGLVVYGGVLFLLKEIRPEEIIGVVSILRSRLAVRVG